MALNLRERCTKRLVGMKAARLPYEDEWRETASCAQPARSRFLNKDTNQNARQRNKKLNSSHGIFAFRTLQGGMTSGLSSPSRPWKVLRSYDEGLMEDQEAKVWFGEVDRRMDSFLAQTNFYQAAKTGYLEMGLFGGEACVMVEHPSEGAVCHQLTAGEYWIGLGSAMTPEALYRRVPMTVIQAVQRFPWNRLCRRIREAYDNSRYEEICNLFHAIELNDERDPSYVDARGKMFRSVWWDESNDTKGGSEYGACLEVSGYEEQPFWAPRWDTTGADVYGVGPGADALPDLRELQLQTKRKGEATDFLLKPEIVAPSRVKLRRVPGSVVSAASVDIEKVSVPYTVPYQAIDAVNQDVQRCMEAIDRASYADLFMAITNMQGIQPRNVEEIASRNEEKLTQLGPVIERVNNEKLEVAIERTLGIMSRAGLLPPPPESLAETEIKTEFVSILTQMQRMVGLGQIERFAGFASATMAAHPEAKHKIAVFEMIDEYGQRAGVPPKIIIPTEQAQASLMGEIEDQRAAAMAEQIANMAPVGKVAVDAAKVAADAPPGIISPINELMPLP